MTAKRLLSGLALAVLATGCTVGPDYHAPEIAVPAAYQGAPDETATQETAADPATWWQSFGDPELDSLITRALAGNPDIQVAASRVRQARLAEIAASANGKPTVDAQAGGNYVHFSKNAGFSSLAQLFSGGSGGGSNGSGSGVALPGNSITTYSAGFDASWELDLFGGARRGVEAAKARTEAAVWNGRDASVTLAAEVADAYFMLRADQDRARIVNEEIDRQTRALQIAAHVAQVGLSPHIDVTRQNASITSLRAALEPINADLAVRTHALGILLGETPETLTTELAAPGPMMADVAPAIPAGLPSDLLRRRPDIRAAERQLAAATADIGVAVADLYPKFNLTGVAELISTALSNLLTADSLQLTGSGAVQFPLLDWGKRRATVGMRKEDREQAYLAYRKTVLGALRDVEDALSQIDTERRRNATLRKAQADREKTARSVEAQYRTGFVAQDSLLNAQTDVLQAREQVTMSDAQLREYSAALFKALGGGWQSGGAMAAN